jgi:C1A family cysteine protease
MTHKTFGWKQDVDDARDWRLPEPTDEAVAALPSAVGLPGLPVMGQGNTSSCTAHAVAYAHRFDQVKQRGRTGLDWQPSRLFIYWNARVLDQALYNEQGRPIVDEGCSIRSGIKSLSSYGVPGETYWSWRTSKVNAKPTTVAYQEARRHMGTSYWRVAQTEVAMKQCLASGFPFVVGIFCYESMDTEAVDRTGDLPMPGPREALLGGHAILITGYDDSRQRFTFENSWGASWGRGGFGTVPYAYMAGQSSDPWTLRQVTL